MAGRRGWPPRQIRKMTHILVVEDEPTIACTLQADLTAEGYDVTVAATRRSFGQLLRWARGVGGERCGRLRIAGMSRGRWSGSCSRAANASCVSRRS